MYNSGLVFVLRNRRKTVVPSESFFVHDSLGDLQNALSVGLWNPQANR